MELVILLTGFIFPICFLVGAILLLTKKQKDLDDNLLKLQPNFIYNVENIEEKNNSY